MRKSLLILGIALASAGFTQDFNPLNFFSSNEIGKASTGQNVDYLTQEEKDIFMYNNLVRMWPQKFHKMYLAYCQVNGFMNELKNDRYYRTLDTDLKNRQPAGPLLPDRKMFELAECWAVESGEKGIVGHDRVNCPTGYSGENCAYGYGEGFKIVMQLLIDHGVESLGHRKNMLLPDWKGMGTAIRPHTDYRVCAVQNFARTNDALRAKAEKERLEREAAEVERKRLLALRAKKHKELLLQFSDKERGNADLARDLNYLTDFEKDFYFYYNLARMYPAKFKKLIWDEGPYFDRFIEEQTDLKNQPGFIRLDKFLSKGRSRPAFFPQEKYMDAGRCVVKEWQAGGNISTCLPGPGAWRLQTYNPENSYNDIIGIFMTEKDFHDLFQMDGHIVIVEDDYHVVKVFFN